MTYGLFALSFWWLCIAILQPNSGKRAEKIDSLRSLIGDTQRAPAGQGPQNDCRRGRAHSLRVMFVSALRGRLARHCRFSGLPIALCQAPQNSSLYVPRRLRRTGANCWQVICISSWLTEPEKANQIASFRFSCIGCS
jgi:hypothetical protein